MVELPRRKGYSRAVPLTTRQASPCCELLIRPANMIAPQVLNRGGKAYADPTHTIFDSISEPESNPCQPVALETTVSTASGEIGDPYPQGVYSLGGRFCVVVAMQFREFDIAHLDNLRYEYQFPEDWATTESWCYICHHTHTGIRTLACDHCGRSACAPHFRLSSHNRGEMGGKGISCSVLSTPALSTTLRRVKESPPTSCLRRAAPSVPSLARRSATCSRR